MKDYNLKYNYVYFNTCYLSNLDVDPNEYNAICLRDATQMEGVVVVQRPLDYASKFWRFLLKVHTSAKLNRIINLPFKSFWYRFYFKAKFKVKKPLCFVFGEHLPLDYVRYLKKKYPDCKTVKIHRDLVKIIHAMRPEMTEEAMNSVFDLRMSYDKGEAKKYGFAWFDEIESKIDIPIDKNYPLCDVFFAGKAKDRLPKIIAAYDKLTAAGLKCDFYVTNVPKEKQIPRSGITYADKLMPYIDMLYKSANCRCMLDINQEGAIGLTSRVLEAILYNKRLIVDNPYVKEMKYYNPNYIQLVGSFEDMDTDFVKREDAVDYHYDGDHSPVHLIKQIDELLSK